MIYGLLLGFFGLSLAYLVAKFFEVYCTANNIRMRGNVQWHIFFCALASVWCLGLMIAMVFAS